MDEKLDSDGILQSSGDNFNSYSDKNREIGQSSRHKKTTSGVSDSRDSNSGQVVTEEDILTAQFGTRPAMFCREVQAAFSAVEVALKIASFEELSALETVIKCRKKELKVESSKDKTTFKRNFYQVEVREGVFVWYLRKRENGKLSKLEHFGNSLPEDLNLQQDNVNFLPKYLVLRHSDWLKLPNKTRPK